MAENIDIESKLCSYVEGDLDAASRAEIERYLAANPQYRAVLDELIRTRGELRALPRVRAPMDVQENISGQLERSALLGTDDLRNSGSGMKRFPYFRAWAAIIVLGLALSAVIYSVLPARKAQLPELAALTTRPIDTEINSTSPATMADRSAAEASNATVLAMAAPATPEPTAATTSIADLLAEQTAVHRSDATLPVNPSDAQTPAALALVIPSANLPATESRVHEYLRSQNFSYATSVTTVADGTAAPAAVVTAGEATNQSLTAAGLQQSPVSKGPIGGPEIRMITVRQLTNSQMQQTRAAFANLDQNSVVEAYVTPVAHLPAFAPTTASNWENHNPATAPLGGDLDLVPGQQIQISAQDNGLNVAAMDEVMTIDPAGDITLPLVGKVRAAGLTPSALSQSIALQYEIAKSPTRATWTIHPLAATSPVANGNAFAAAMPMKTAAATPAATQPALAQQPTTQSGQGGLTVANSSEAGLNGLHEHPMPLSTSLPTTSPAPVALSPSATEPSEPRSDLFIVLVQTAAANTTAASIDSVMTPPPATLPTTAPLSVGHSATTAP